MGTSVGFRSYGLDACADTDTLCVQKKKVGERNIHCKNTLFEPSTRIPFMVRVPWLNDRRVDVSMMVDNVDVLPTIASLALGPSALPPCLQGRDLSRLFRGKPLHEDRGWALSQYGRCPNISQNNFWSDPCTRIQAKNPGTMSYMGYTIRTKDWRYVEWRTWDGVRADWSAHGLNATELYSHSKDVRGTGFDDFENENVAVDHPDVVAKLSAVLHDAATFQGYDSQCLPQVLQQ